MYDADAIEAINFDQLATATDRLLLRGRVSRHRLGTASRARISRPSIVSATQPRGPRVRFERGPGVHFERTVIIRPPGSRAHVFAVTVVIPALAGITVGLAALL